MNRIRNYVTDNTLKLIYHSLIYPHLLYGISVWGNADITHLDSLRILQKKAVRIISNKHKNIHSLFTLPGDPEMYWLFDTFIKEASTPLFNNLNILKISDIFNASILNFVYDSLNNINPSQFHDYFRYPPNNYNTAANRRGDLDTPQVRTTTYGLKSIKYFGCILWNNLPISIKNSLSKKIFNKSVKRHFINSYI